MARKTICEKCCNTNPKSDPLRQLMKSPTMRLAECQRCTRRALAENAKLKRLIVKAHKLNSMYDSGLRNEAIRLMMREAIASGKCGECLGNGKVYDGHDPDDGWTTCPKCKGTGKAVRIARAAKGRKP